MRRLFLSISETPHAATPRALLRSLARVLFGSRSLQRARFSSFPSSAEYVLRDPWIKNLQEQLGCAIETTTRRRRVTARTQGGGTDRGSQANSLPERPRRWVVLPRSPPLAGSRRRRLRRSPGASARRRSPPLRPQERRTRFGRRTTDPTRRSRRSSRGCVPGSAAAAEGCSLLLVV